VRRVLLAVLLVGAAVPWASARDALQVLDECLGKPDTSVEVTERCPELSSALTQSSFAAWLPRDWNRPDNQLSAQGLSELRVLLTRLAEARPARATSPAVQHVAGVLAALTRQEQAQVSWWTRFKEWLRRMMSGPSQSGENWLERWLNGVSLSRGARDVVTWGCMAVVVALALAVVVNELRVARLVGRRRVAGVAGAGGAEARADLTLAQIETAMPREQPALLLVLIAARLAARELLPPARTLTGRELARRARLADPSGRAHLAQLVAVCELIRFADEDVDEGVRVSALEAGRALLRAIDDLPTVAVPA
jgi:hypothetical protein